MWHCSHCGEAIDDKFDACRRCGEHRGTDAEEFEAELDEPSAPESNSESPESDQESSDEMTADGPPERALTQEGLAALLLRFLGLCFAAFGVVGILTMAGNLFLDSTEYGLDSALRHYFHLKFLMSPAAELIIGIYFLVGGQWVYDKILTPVSRTSPEDEFDEPEEDDDSWRTWKSADGAYTVEAKFVRVTGEMVDLLKEDGTTITIERSKLSQDDQNWVTDHEKPSVD